MVKIKTKSNFRFFSSHVVDMDSPLRVDKTKQLNKLKGNEKPLGLETWTQTDLTLPPILPPDVEAVLARYCIFGGRQKTLNNSDLNTSTGSRKKLLFRNFNYLSPERKVCKLTFKTCTLFF